MILKSREKGTVEFVLEHGNAEIPYVVGSWDNWSLPGIPMVRAHGESPVCRATLSLAPGGYQFRYRLGDHWFNDPSADFYVDNGLGAENSVVIVEGVLKKTPRKTSSGAAKPRKPKGRPAGG